MIKLIFSFFLYLVSSFFWLACIARQNQAIVLTLGMSGNLVVCLTSMFIGIVHIGHITNFSVFILFNIHET